MSDPNPPIPGQESKTVSFENLLRMLDQDRDRAGDKYEQLRRKLIKFFEWNSCFPAEDLADETFIRLEKRIGDVEMEDVIGFTWGIAKNLRQETRKEVARTVHISDLPGGERTWPDPRDSGKMIEEKMEQERRFKCLQICLARMARSDHQLFLAYHDVQGDHLRYRQELARQLGLSIGALRVRINRLRNRLEKCATQCFALWQVNSRKEPGTTVIKSDAKSL